MRRLVVAVVILWCSVTPHQAQLWDSMSNPTVSVRLNHPPLLGVKFDKIAFGPASGPCADQVVDGIIGDFVSGGVEVVDHQHLQTLMSEHEMSLSGFIDQSSAARIGKILGPAALVFVKVQRCSPQQDRSVEKQTYTKNNVNYTINNYIARTRVSLKGSIQTVVLETGKIFAATPFEFAPEESNESTEGLPPFPPADDMTDRAVRQAVTMAHQMFLPWSEMLKLVYFDDKPCELKKAFELLKAGDVAGAMKQSQVNLEACRKNPEVKDKVLGHALYNVGMGHMFANEYDAALANFREASLRRPGEIVTKAISDCQRAQQLQSAMQQYEERAVFASSVEEAPAAAAPAASRADSAEERLRQIDALFKKGLISKEDYDKKKAEILKDL